MKTLILSDDNATVELQALEVPFTTSTIESSQDVQTADNNISTYFTPNKRQWSHTWRYLSEEQFNELKGFYDRQFTLYKYPLVSIPEDGVENIAVRMYLDPKRVVDDCGVVENTSITLRETRN